MRKIDLDSPIGRKPRAWLPHGCQSKTRVSHSLLFWRARLRRAGRGLYLGLVRQNSDPDKMAKGLALGVFLGIFPTFGAGFGAGSSGVVPAGMEPCRGGTGHVNRES